MVQAVMRKNQRVIWTVIAIVVVITFVFWGVSTGPSNSRGEGTVGTLYGKKVSTQEFLDTRRMVYNYFLLFLRQDLDRDDPGRMMLEQQTWVRLIERKKIRDWDITVTDDQLVAFIQGMFSDNGRFDPKKYREFTERQLPAHRMTAADFEKMVREDLCLQELRRIVGSTTKVQPTELREVHNIIHEKLDLSVVTFDGAPHTNDVKLTDAEIKDYFEKNKNIFTIPERRRVRYVRFGNEAYTNEVKVADAEVRAFYDQNKSMFEAEKGTVRPFDAVASEIQQQLIHGKAFARASDAAGEMALEILKPNEGDPKQSELAKVDFAALARKHGVKIQETDFFSMRAPVTGIEAGPYFNQAAFALTAKEPFSDVVSGQDGAYILEYLEEKPSELPTLESIKDQVVQRMTVERAINLARSKGRESNRQVKDAVLKAPSPGSDPAKVFADEAQKLGLKPLNPPPFSQRDIDADVPERAAVLDTAFAMREGEVSDFVPTSRGGLFVFLKRRIPPSDAEFQKDLAKIREQIINQKQQLVMNEWLNREYRLANPPQLAPPQQKQEQTPVAPGVPSAPPPVPVPPS